MKIVDDNLVWMYEPSTTGINKDVETIITGDTDSGYVKVVRCKDCKHLKGKRDMCLHEDIRYRYVCGDFATFEPDEDFWCKYGERKTENA